MSFQKRLKAELTEKIAEKRRLPSRRAFVRECFILGGAVSNPERTYHLEFSIEDSLVRKLLAVLSDFGISPKTTDRKGRTVVYLKDADAIADCMKIMGAGRTLLDFEELRVRKQVRNNVNRKVNFETANLDKTTRSAISHVETINEIDRKIGLANIPKELQEIARLRLENEDESLSLCEIGASLDPPISKSGVNHRMRKLKSLLRKLD